MLKVKEGLIKALQEEIGADEDEVEVTETVEEVTEVVRMNNVTTYHTCNACDKNFKTIQDLENHVGSKHVEKDCDFCEKLLEMSMSWESTSKFATSVSLRL